MISINLNLKGKADNLKLQLFEEIIVADLYYMAIDSNLDLDNEDSRIYTSFVRLMIQWRKRIEDLETVTYLPFDFSDQYIGCLKIVKVADNTLSLIYGYTTEIEGWKICPSNFEGLILNKDSFIADTKSIIIAKEKLLAAIDIAIAENTPFSVST